MELKKYKLGDIAETGSGGTPKSTVAEYYDNGIIPWINSGELNQPFIRDAKNYITKTGLNNSSAKLFPADTVLLAMYGATAGKASLLKFEATTNQAICAIIPNKQIVEPLFLKYKFDTMYDYLVGLSTGSARDNLSQIGIRNLKISLPELSTQRRISSILSTLDQKIALNRKINDNLEAMAKQLYDYWFVQFDFPNEEGKPYKSSGGKMVWNEKLKREIPEGWEVKSINDLSTICRGVSYKPSDLQYNGVLILRGNNIENNRIIYDNNTAFLSPNLISAEQKIKRHDIIITMSSGSKEHIGKCAMFQLDSEHSFGAFLSKITPNKDCPHFIFLFLSSTYFKQKIKSVCNGTGINNLTNQTFDEVKFAYPTPNTLKLFERRIQSIFGTIGNNDAENEVLTKQRDELLPLLMNGQVSVNYD